MDSSQQPLVSFVLLAYKQEQFIREAVNGALSQTYSPLEIILSDDCSPDRTFDIMQEIVAAYSGPHHVILNRNESNLRICGNLNMAVALSHGEFIVGAAGDDISLPNRCERLVEEWIKPGRRWHSICSDAEIIDREGRRKGCYCNFNSFRELSSLDQVLHTGIVGISGCTHAFSRQIFDVFGPIDERSLGEDELLGFRSLILGGACWIPDQLILYRRHGENVFNNTKDLKNTSRVRRKLILKSYYMDCMLGEEFRRNALQTAVDKGYLTQEKADFYEQTLRHNFPTLKFTVYYNKRWATAIGWLIFAFFNGEYRPGMISLFESNHLPNWVMKLSRSIRRPFMLIRK